MKKVFFVLSLALFAACGTPATEQAAPSADSTKVDTAKVANALPTVPTATTAPVETK